MRFIKSFVYSQFIVCLFFVSLVYSAPVGKFTYVEGKVDLTPPGKKAVPVKIGMLVSMGDIIRTKSRSKAEITFNDGNILRLAQNTRVEITQYIVGTEKSSRILGLYRGNIQNIVKKTIASKIARFIKAHKYEVHTPIAVVGVKGTVFFAFHTKLGSGAIFKEGVGYCYAKKLPQKIVYIHAGQKVFVASPTTVPVVKRATKTELKKFETETSPKKEGRKKSTSSIKRQGGKESKKEKKSAFKEKRGGIKEERRKVTQKTENQRRTTQVKRNIKIVHKKTIESTGEVARHITSSVSTTTSPSAEGVTGYETSTTYFVASVSTENEVYIPITESKEEVREEVKENIISQVTSSEKKGENIPLQEEVTSEQSSESNVTEKITSSENNIMSGGGGGGGSADTIPPSVSIRIVPASESNKSKIEITTDEPATISWNLDNTRSGNSDTIEDVDEGSHTLSVSAEDEAGNRTDKTYSFDIKRYGLRNCGYSNISGSGSSYSGLISGEVAASIDDNKGSWNVSISGTYSGQHSDSWQLNGGGYSVDSSDNSNGYYFYEASGTYSGSEMYGSSYLRVLTKKTYGEGWGGFYGSYDAENSTWQGESFGDYECKSLEYSGELSWSDDWSKGPYRNLFGDNGSGGFTEVGDLSSPLIGGITSPWNSLPNNTSEFYIMGEYSLYDSSYTAPYIWTANLYSKNWDSSQYTTYDNGAFYGFAGGVWLNNGEIWGGTVALYISPDKEIGFIRGNIEEADECEDSYTSFESTGMFTTDGEWWELEKKADSSLEPSNFYNLVKTHSNIGFKMDAKLYDENDVASGLIEGISYLFDTNNKGGWTRYLDGEKWGIFNIIINGYEPQSFQNPNNLTSWRGAIGGDAYFGTYYNGSSYIDDYGYWIAWVGGYIDIYEDSELYGHISGNFLTLTKMGYISGNIYGYYNGDKWAGTALGVYEADKDVVFSSCIGLYDIPKGKLFALTEATLNYGKYYNQDQEYYYEYSTNGIGRGYSAYYPQINKKYYYSNGKMMKYEYEESNGYLPPDNPPDISLEDWDVSNLSELGNSPGTGWTKDDSASGTRTINLSDSAGEFSLILGGYVPEEGTPASLWEATIDNHMPIYLIGQIGLIKDAYKDKPLIFHSEIRSINPYDLTYTTPDGGAYVGFIGGVLSISQTTDGGNLWMVKW